MTADESAGASRWRVEVDRELCIGGGVCVSTAPSHFVLDGGRSRPIAEEVAPDDFLVEAALCCPVEAISVHDVASGALIAPEE
jgi:ferredoxin